LLAFFSFFLLPFTVGKNFLIYFRLMTMSPLKQKCKEFFAQLAISCSLAFTLLSCATYYQHNVQFNEDFERGNIEQAKQDLAGNPKEETGKDRFLYWVNFGVVASMLGEYQKSNELLAKAYDYTEHYKASVTDVSATFLVNPMLSAYKPEDHEVLLIHYYMAMNYVMMGNYEDALVECRQLDLALKDLSAKYKSEEKYQADAFVNVLSGLIYDASGDYNNAFIAYRNALEIYQKDYQRLFGVSAPEQLKQDLLRTAYLTGLDEELARYEKEFGIKFTPGKEKTGELLFIWNNGLGPVKAEWGITFTVIRGTAGAVSFHNEDLGLTIPFPLGSGGDGLGDLEFVRVVFPKYVERPPMFTEAMLAVGNQQYPLQLIEDVNKIAFKTLQERMLLELSESLLRVAIKKSEEYAVRQQSEGWGAVLGAVNAMTEKADTRNWQTLPHSIYYTRVPLAPGMHEVQLQYAGQNDAAHAFTFDIQTNKTVFHSFHTLATAPYDYNL